MKRKKIPKQDSGIDSNKSFGQKHLIKCRCVLPQMKNSSNPVPHHFIVFSEFNDGQIKIKFSQCNNCGVIHKITDICSSEIMDGKDAMSSILTIDDIRFSMNKGLSSILDRHNCDLPTWEHAQYALENKKWGEIVILSSDTEKEDKIIKYLRILGESLFKVDSHIRKETLGD
jgi:hypothetical protein